MFLYLVSHYESKRENPRIPMINGDTFHFLFAEKNKDESVCLTVCLSLRSLVQIGSLRTPSRCVASVETAIGQKITSELKLYCSKN